MSGFEQLPFDGDEVAPSEVAAEPTDAAPPELAPEPVEDEGSAVGAVDPIDPLTGPAPEPAGTEPAPAVTSTGPAPVSKPRSFQASAGIQGRQFAEQCDTLLTHFGFELKGRRVLTEVGVEIDQEAVSPDGTTVWFEYKGSIQGKRPGLIRTDTLKKAIANGALLRSLPDPAPYVVVTSHLPEAGSGAAMLDAALRLRYFADVVCLYDPKATARLSNW